MSRATGTIGLQLKQWGAYRGAILALGIVVLLATFAVTAWPRAVAETQTGDLRYRVNAQAAALRVVQTSQHQQGMPPGSAGQLEYLGGFTWDSIGNILKKAHGNTPQPLRGVLRAPQWVDRTDPLGTTGPLPDYHYNVQLEAFPALRDEAKLVAGQWPAPYRAKQNPQLPPGTVGPILPTTAPIEIVLSADTAKKMGWTIGQTRSIPLGLDEQPVKLSGTVAPREATTDFWSIDPLRARPSLVKICRGGQCDGGIKITAVAWLDPGSWSQLQYSFSGDVTGWFGIDSNALTSANLPAVQTQLAKFLASPPTGGVPLHFSTSLTDTLTVFGAASGSTQTLLLLLAAGPLGAAIAVLILGAELLVDRRRPVLALLAARGASALRIRGSLALEGALVAVPAALVGTIAAVVLFPPTAGEPIGTTTIVLGLCCAAAPPIILAALAGGLAVDGGRRRWRWVLEVVVVLAAIVALLVLFQRGLAPPSTGAADPLLVLTPLLLALAVCVIVLRVYPLPLRAIAVALRKRRGAVGVVGSARSRQGIAGALIPVLAVLVGVAVTMFSVVVFQTERAGVAQASVGRVGADLSVTGPSLTASQLTKTARVPGVRGIVPVSGAGYAALTMGGDLESVRVLVADTAALGRVQAALPDSVRVPSGMQHTVDGKLPVVVGNWPTTTSAKDATLTTTADIAVRVVSTQSPIGATGNGVPWILVDRHQVPKGADGQQLVGALLALDAGADADTVAAAVQKIAGADAEIDNAATQAREIRAAPVVGGIEFALLAAAALGTVFAVLALVLMLVMGAAARVRLTATLRTLGFSRGQTTWLVAWEIGPIVVAGLIAGIVVGLLLPPIVLAPLNLTAFSGGVQPPVTIDGWTIAAFVLGLLVLLAGIVAVTLIVAARRNPAGVLRTGEDE